MKRRLEEKTNRCIRRLMAGMLIGILSVTALTGCKYRITDKTVEEEVDEALSEARDEWMAEAEREKDAAVERALKEYSEKQEQNATPDPGEVKDLPKPDTSAMTDDKLDQMIEITPTEADNSGNVETAVEDNLQIVFMGDSIFDSIRDETGIAYQVGSRLEADIYNLSIGGTTAALTPSKAWQLDAWTEPSFLGVIYAMENKVDRSILSGYKSGEVMETLVPAKTDYFIVEYGTNDFLSYIPIGGDGGLYYKFSTAIEMGIRELKENYPDAKIILCTPYYEQFWSADRTKFIGDIHSVNNGYGTLLDYIGWAEGVARDMGAETLNMYDLLAVDAYNVDKLTVDGIHPNEELRATYAGILVDKINELEDQE